MSREEARWLTAGKGAAGRGSAQARLAQGRGREEEAQGRGTCRSDSYVCVGRMLNGIWIVRTPVFSHWLWFHVGRGFSVRAAAGFLFTANCFWQ